MGASGKNDQGELEWSNVTFSDPNVVRGLIRCRYKFDMLYGREEGDLLSSGTDLNDMKQEIHLTYIVLDELITDTILTQKQREILHMFMDGWTEEDIAEHYKDSVSVIFRYIDRICDAIASENLRKWRKVIQKNKLDIPVRVCGSCGESLPLSNDFYSLDKGCYKYICKKCNRLQRK